MQDSNYPSRDDNYNQLTQHLLNSESPLNYSLEYLLENYGDRAVPALLQALPVRPWFEQQLILEALGKLGDISAIVPICALLYGQGKSAKQLEDAVIRTLRSLVYYCEDKKKATTILIDTVLKYQRCLQPLTEVLKDQKNKFSIKMAYKKLYRRGQNDYIESAIAIIGDEEGLTEYRIKFLKKMLYKLDNDQLRDQVVASLKILISKKRCQRLCSKKGMKFDAFFRRPDNGCYDCCCVDKNDKRVLVNFASGHLPDKKATNKSIRPNPIRPQGTKKRNSSHYKY